MNLQTRQPCAAIIGQQADTTETAVCSWIFKLLFSVLQVVFVAANPCVLYASIQITNVARYNVSSLYSHGIAHTHAKRESCKTYDQQSFNISNILCCSHPSRTSKIHFSALLSLCKHNNINNNYNKQ